MQILGLINEALGLPELASEHGSLVDQMLEMVHWLVAILLVGWTGYFFYCLFRFRARRNPKADYHGVRGHASSHIELAVVVVEAILLIGFAFPLWAQRASDYPTGDDVVRVRAVGKQFGWTYHYPGPDGRFGKVDPYLIDANNPAGLDLEDPNALDDFTTGIALILPKDRPCIVSVTSQDVIHNLHLVPMRMAQDATPGIIADMWFKPIKTGKWETICGQLCGVGHANMKSSIEVMEEDAFDEWYESNTPKAPADEPVSPEAADAGSASSGQAS